MEIDERIDLDEYRFQPNKLAVLWSMADFIRTELEELIGQDKLDKAHRYYEPTTTHSDALDL